MTHPDQVRVATDALRADAIEWDQWAQTMARASTTARGLRLDSLDFSIASELTNLPELYEELRQRAEDLARGGQAAFTEISRVLVSAAQSYDQSDRNAVDRFHPN